MSRFKNEITHLQAHIKTLRLGAGALVVVALVMGGGVSRVSGPLGESPSPPPPRVVFFFFFFFFFFFR